MKAPDKIYISPMPNPADGYVGIAWADAHRDMVEYISKSALLEWAEDKWLSLRNGTLADQIRSSAFQEVFKHIESL